MNCFDRTGDKLKINNELIAQTDVKCPLCQVNYIVDHVTVM